MRPENATPPACAPADSSAPAAPAKAATARIPRHPRRPTPRRPSRGVATFARPVAARARGPLARACAGAAPARAPRSAARLAAGAGASGPSPTSDDPVLRDTPSEACGAAARAPRRRQREPSGTSLGLGPPFFWAHTRTPRSLIIATERHPEAHLEQVSRFRAPRAGDAGVPSRAAPLRVSRRGSASSDAPEAPWLSRSRAPSCARRPSAAAPRCR